MKVQDQERNTQFPHKLRFMKALYVLGLVFSAYSVSADYLLDGVLNKKYDIVIVLFCLVVLVFCRFERFSVWLFRLTLAAGFLAFSITAFTQLHRIEMFLWLPVSPFLFFYLGNQREGLYWTFALIATNLLAYLLYPYYQQASRIDVFLYTQLITTMLFATALAYFYERIRHEQDHLLQTQAKMDYLTSIFNRRGLAERMELELNRVERYDSLLSFMLIDIDDFKRINDQFGHHTGDDFLAGFARLLASNIRRSDTLARWGGEEFALIMPEADVMDAHKMAEKLRGLVERAEFSRVGKVTISIGLTEYQTGDRLEDLSRRADVALYDAKRKEKNRVEIHPLPVAESA